MNIRNLIMILSVSVIMQAAMPAAQAEQGGASHHAPANTKLGTPPRVVKAKGRLVCNDKVYLFSTGTGGGSCVSGVGNGDCQDGANSSSATCKGGCGATSGKGTCTTE